MRTVSDDSLVLIQSRLNSSRLPGKALLPIEGIPMVALAALRAANTGKSVLVLTSTDSADDEICLALDKYSINYFRGPLDNVLERFYLSTLELPDQKIIFRLTADNVLPDGSLLDEMEKQFHHQNVDILNCTPLLSNLPYGVSAEIFRVKTLRNAFANSVDDFDKEHVTPYIYRNGTFAAFRPIKFSGFHNFRMTIDTIDDYISVKSLFKNVQDVINASIESLLHNVGRMRYRPFCKVPMKSMTLGTVQFGLNYGVTNRLGKVPRMEAIDIIRNAITEGVEYLDTASAYGDSEVVIGEALRGGWGDRVKVITKLSPFDNEIYFDDTSWALAVRNEVLRSCLNLGTKKLHTLMFHKFEHILREPIIKEVINLKNEGIINQVGASVQTPSELQFVLDRSFISIIQLPFNILDYRWEPLISKIMHAKESRNLTIHARSSLLQGLLCSTDKQDWIKAGIENCDEVINWLDCTYKQHKKSSISDLCINFVNSQSWIDSVVVGVESVSNLRKNLQSISSPFLSECVLRDISQSAPRISEHSLNPSTWS